MRAAHPRPSLYPGGNGVRTIAGRLLVACVLVADPTPLTAAQPQPEVAVQRFLALVEARDWPGATALVRPEALESFRNVAIQLLVASAEATTGRPPPRSDGRPAPMAERLARQDSMPVAGLSRAYSVGEFARLPPATVLEESLALRYTALRGRTPRIIGTVVEDDSTAWVLVRQVVPPGTPVPPTAPSMVSLVLVSRLDNRWLLGNAAGLFSPADLVSPALRGTGTAGDGVPILVQAMPGSGPWPASPAATAGACDARRVYYSVAADSVSRPFLQTAEVAVLQVLGNQRITAPAPAGAVDTIGVLHLRLATVSQGGGVSVELEFRRGPGALRGIERSVVAMPPGDPRAQRDALRGRIREIVEQFAAGGLPGPCR